MKFDSFDLRHTFGETLTELGDQYENLVVLDADLHTSVYTSAFRKKFPDRFVQCGIAEADMFSIAAGMAHMGYIAVPATFAAFTTRKALDPLYLNICCQQLNVKIPGCYPGMTATECGQSHNTCDDIATIRALPHIRVADPGDKFELASLMRETVKEVGPCYYRVSKTELPQLFDSSYQFSWGRGYELTCGKDVAILSTGMMTGIALKAAEMLTADRVEATVLHMPSIDPLDGDLIVKAAKRTGCLITLENARTVGGFGGAVAELLGEQYPALLTRMGIGNETVASGDLATLLTVYRLTPRDVAEQAKALIARK